MYYYMILKLSEGETLEYIAKISALSVEKIIELNGYRPKENMYFFINRENEYIVKENDTILSISRKTKLSINEINSRGRIIAGKKFYY